MYIKRCSLGQAQILFVILRKLIQISDRKPAKVEICESSGICRTWGVYETSGIYETSEVLELLKFKNFWRTEKIEVMH